jgi:hypothetical protein
MKTNRERLNKMSNEDFAEWICGIADCNYCPCDCSEAEKCAIELEQWLNNESEE